VRAKYSHENERYVLGMVVMASCQLCGINGIFYYAKQLLGEVTGGDVRLAQELMLGLAFCQGASSLICSRFVDLFGRKFLLMKGQQILIGILLAIFVVDNLGDEMGIPGLSYLTVMLIYAHVIIFNFSLGPVAVIYAAELVPNMTPMIVSLRTATFMVALSTNYIIHEFGIGQLFLLFGVLTAVAHTFLQRRLRETKGKSKPQIFQMFELDYDPEEKTGFL
jgi:MFS family permease